MRRQVRDGYIAAHRCSTQDQPEVAPLVEPEEGITRVHRVVAKCSRREYTESASPTADRTSSSL